MAREAGAKKVYLASCAPAIRYPNVYGIDMPSPHELVAYNKTEDEIAQTIGADRVFFQVGWSTLYELSKRFMTVNMPDN